MLYDIETLARTEFDSAQQYLEFCADQYFTVCRGQSVLEIGPGDGRHTKLIMRQDPITIELIEGHEPCKAQLEDLAVRELHQDDVMLFLDRPRPFDVVICLGVLYHLHSPLHLLELIVNHCRPRMIILDCVMAPQHLQLLPEPKNMYGSNQPRSNWRSCDVNIVLPFLTYLQVLEHMGYVASKIHRITVRDDPSKHNSWMALWEDKNDCG